jgi:hypothetical protein
LLFDETGGAVFAAGVLVPLPSLVPFLDCGLVRGPVAGEREGEAGHVGVLGEADDEGELGIGASVLDRDADVHGRVVVDDGRVHVVAHVPLVFLVGFRVRGECGTGPGEEDGERDQRTGLPGRHRGSSFHGRSLFVEAQTDPASVRRGPNTTKYSVFRCKSAFRG